MSSPARAWLLVAVALTSLVALSGGLPAAGAAVGPAAAAAAPPWESAGPFAPSFDLRTEGRVTPVRSQDQFSTCWIMAATGSLESALVTVEGAPLDFSENNLANHMASRLVYQGRAPSELAAAYFARWEGPVLESADPYPRPDPGGSPPYLRAVRHVQEILFLPQRTPGPDDNAAVKWAVSTYGGVDAAIAMDTRRYWEETTDSYYNGQGGELNHHVVCVGWDDDYSADNFLNRPDGDGAFLIKNSWGTDWGDKGYFWISYYDVSFGDALAVFDGVAPAADYDAIYQHDALGRSGWIGLGGEQAWYASRFHCVGSGDVAAVSFYTPVPGTAYEVRVAGSVLGVASAPVAASGTVAVGGYHTIRLETPASVTDGDVFIAAVHVTTPGSTQPVPVERPSRLIAPRAQAGQSYVSADGVAWQDLTSRAGLAKADVCLKAFVDAAGAADTSPPHVAVSGDSVPRGASAHVRWRLDDPAFSSASAVVVLTVRDARGAVVAHRRIPAVAVGERGTWSFAASWPRGTYAVRGLAYDVAGRRQTVASRASVVVRGRAPRSAPAPRGH